MEQLIRWSWTFGLAGLALEVGAFSGWFLAGGVFTTPTQGLAIAGALLLLLYAALDRERMGQAVRAQGTQYRVTAVLLVGMAFVLGLGVFAITLRHDDTLDLTSSGDFTLSAHSKQALTSLGASAEVFAFFPHGVESQRRFRRLADRVNEATDKLTFQWIDPLTEPLMAERFDITGQHGTVVVVIGDRTRRLEMPIEESEFVSALLSIAKGDDHRICWSLGHGEADPDDEISERGLGNVVLALEGDNYQVTKSFIATEGIDRACEALVVARPELDFLPFELEALAAYLGEGGAVFMMLEPGRAPGLRVALERYGISLGADIVFDLTPSHRILGVEDEAYVSLTDDNFLTHPITASLSAVVLPVTQSVSINRGLDGYRSSAILQTGEEAWGEREPDQPPIGPDPGEVVGDVPLLVLVEVEEPEALHVVRPEPVKPKPVSVEDGVEVVEDLPGRSIDAPLDAPSMSENLGRAVPADYQPMPGGRLLVMGDADYANNIYMSWGNNRDLFLNSIAWLVEEHDQLGARPKSGDKLELAASDAAMMFLVGVVLVPGGTLVLALLTWLRRRRL